VLKPRNELTEALIQLRKDEAIETNAAIQQEHKRSAWNMRYDAATERNRVVAPSKLLAEVTGPRRSENPVY